MAAIGIGLALPVRALDGLNAEPGTSPDARTLSVSPDVKIIMPPYFHGSASGLGALLGGGAGALLAKGASDEAGAIATYVNEHQIDVGGIVRKEFEAALASRPDYAGRIVAGSAQRAEAQLGLSVKYGLTKIGFGGGYRPYLWVEVRQFGPQGAEAWMVRDYVGATSKLSKDMSFEQFFASPEVFTDAFVIAAKEVAPLLVKKLK